MISNLRISVTQRCNLTCPYCHMEGQLSSIIQPSLDQIENVVRSAKEVGIKQIKITGGEPLLRKDITDVIGIIKSYDFEDISLVTNAFRLDVIAKDLKEAGLDRINIGCDSLVMEDTIEYKTKKGMIKGLTAAKEAGLEVKINMVVLKGINDSEITEMVEFAKENKVTLQLIELLETDKEYYNKHYFSLELLEKEFEKKAVAITQRALHNRKQYDLGDVKVEIVRPIDDEFCKNCRRIRMTSDGKIKPCIMMNNNLIDFTDKESLLKAIRLKEELIQIGPRKKIMKVIG